MSGVLTPAVPPAPVGRGYKRLNYVSSQCAHGKSFIARKTEIHSKKNLIVKNFPKL